MKQVKGKNQQILNIKEVRILLIFCAIITLYFNSNLADPFNSAKQYLLIMASAWLTGNFLVGARRLELKALVRRKYIILVLIFSVSGLVSFINTEPTFVGLFGETQRKTGFITYLCLSIFLLFAAKYITDAVRKQYYFYSLVTLALFATYGNIQYLGFDFIQWVNPYNSIISTLGNPNYASAFLAVMATFCFSAIFLNVSNFLKAIHIVVVIWSVALIYLSDSKQGLVSIVMGTAVVAGVQILKYKRKLGYLFFALFSLFGLISILGMLQIGPASYYLYKDSVTLRGYYWQAGISMFKSNPLLGVGLDRYGANFSQYKDLDFVVSRGFELMSSNAHNIPIQIFATGGLFYGITYLMINTYILYRAIKGIRLLRGDSLVFISGIFAAWLAYQAQAIVSIENIGMAVWGWVFGGSIIGLSNKQIENQNLKTNSKMLLQPIISIFIIILMLPLLANFIKGESQAFRAQILFNSNNKENMPEINKVSIEIIKNRFADPFHKVLAANYLLNIDNYDGLSALEELVVDDERNSTALSLLANYYDLNGNSEQSIKYRILMSKYDPLNCKNYLKLGQHYKKLGDTSSMYRMRDKILGIAPKSEIAQIASQEFQASS